MLLGAGGRTRFAHAEPEGAVRVEAAGPEQVQAQAGEVLTVVFRVTNTSPEARTFAAHLALPPAWHAVLPQRPFTLAAHAEDLRLISFQVPLDARPGTYEVHYTARDQSDPESFDEGRVVVVVPPVYGLDLTLDKAPRFAEDGEPYQVRFFLFNDGNTATTTLLSAVSTGKYAVQIDPGRIRLAPRSSGYVTVTVSPGAEEALERGERVRHVLRLKAHLEEAPEVSSALGVVTDVISPPGRPRSRRSVLPAEVTMRGVGDGQGLGGQLDLTGSGSVLGGTVEAALTLPDRRRTSFYRDRSRYSLSYRTRGLDLYTGDQVYGLSPLTDGHHYGFGAGGNVRAGRLTLSGFYHRQRHAFFRQDYGGGSIGYRVSDLAQVSTNVLRQRGFRGGDAVTLRTILREGNVASLDGECGLGARNESGRDGPGASAGHACSVRFSFNWPWLSYTANLLRADASYPGRQYGLGAVSSSAVLRPLRWLRLEAMGQRRQRRYDPTYTRRAGVYRFGAGVNARPFGHAAHVYLSYHGQRVGVAQQALASERRETALRLRTGFNAAWGGLAGTVELGRILYDGAGANGRFQHYQMRARGTVRRGWSLNATVDHRRGQTLYRVDERALWRVALGTKLELTRRTVLSLNVSGLFDEYAPGRLARSAQARLRHTFGSGHRLELDARQFGVGDGLFTERGLGEYSVAYVVPFGLPIGAPREQRLSGRVYDAETGAGLEGVALTLDGRTALTGADGRFWLPRPDAEVAYLNLDRISAGLGRIPMQDMPLQVRGREASEIDVPMLQSARLSGQVEVAAGSRQEPVHGAVLELTSGDRRLRAIADRDGRFGFPEVIPGAWTLRVLHARLPAHHAVEQESYGLTLVPGAQDEVRIRVLPKQRRIRMLESGTVLTGRLPNARSRIVSHADSPTEVEVSVRSEGEARRELAEDFDRPGVVPDSGVEAEAHARVTVVTGAQEGTGAIEIAKVGGGSGNPPVAQQQVPLHEETVAVEVPSRGEVEAASARVEAQRHPCRIADLPADAEAPGLGGGTRGSEGAGEKQGEKREAEKHRRGIGEKGVKRRSYADHGVLRRCPQTIEVLY